MYKVIYAALFFTMLLQSCDTKKEESPEEIVLPTEEIQVEERPRREYTTEVRDNWVNYYKKNAPEFKRDNFKSEESFKIIRAKTNIVPVWSKNFNPVYKDFLVYNADSTMYVDFDSYKWGFDDNGELMINPDQEIVLVNIPEQKTERILFYGPSFWVEDAYFKNDSIVVLLENSTDRIPAYQEINLNSNESHYYLYGETLNFDSDYYRDRIARIYPEMP